MVERLCPFIRHKADKPWFLYAEETDEILAYVWGTHDAKNVERFSDSLQHPDIMGLCIDDWPAFKAALPYNLHLIDQYLTGRCFTQALEERQHLFADEK